MQSLSSLCLFSYMFIINLYHQSTRLLRLPFAAKLDCGLFLTMEKKHCGWSRLHAPQTKQNSWQINWIYPLPLYHLTFARCFGSVLPGRCLASRNTNYVALPPSPYSDQSLLSAPMNFNERYFIDFINRWWTHAMTRGHCNPTHAPYKLDKRMLIAYQRFPGLFGFPAMVLVCHVCYNTGLVNNIIAIK